MNPTTRLCPACQSQSQSEGNNRRIQNQSRQSHARAGIQVLQRNLDVTLSPEVVSNQVSSHSVRFQADLMGFPQHQDEPPQGAAADLPVQNSLGTANMQLPEINLASV